MQKSAVKLGIDIKKFTAQDLFLISLSELLNKKLNELYPQAYIQQESWPTSLWNRVTSIFRAG